MSRCKWTAQGANDYYDDNTDRFYDERLEYFIDYVIDQVEGQGFLNKDDRKEWETFAENYIGNLDLETSLDLFAFQESVPVDRMAKIIDNFQEEPEFSEVGEWLVSEYEGVLGDCADQAYEEYRDRQMEEAE